MILRYRETPNPVTIPYLAPPEVETALYLLDVSLGLAAARGKDRFARRRIVRERLHALKFQGE